MSPYSAAPASDTELAPGWSSGSPGRGRAFLEVRGFLVSGVIKLEFSDCYSGCSRETTGDWLGDLGAQTCKVSCLPSQRSPCWSQEERHLPPSVVIATAVTLCQALSSACDMHFSIKPCISICEIGMIRPFFQIRGWKETGATVKNINSGASRTGSGPASALCQPGDFRQVMSPLRASLSFICKNEANSTELIGLLKRLN